MKILIACENSGVVRDAFQEKVNSKEDIVVSCDLLPSSSDSGTHLQCDVRTILYDRDWDLMIAHPDCTYLCSSGLHWNSRVDGRTLKTLEALEFVRELLGAPIKHICIENPVGCIGTKIRKADQYIQPYQFGHDASKKTGLWLKNLPHLQGTGRILPRCRVDGLPRWGNQTDSGQNRLGPSEDRWKARARTYEGIAEAMATQWIDHIMKNSSTSISTK